MNGLPCMSVDNEPFNYQDPESDYPLISYRAEGCGIYGPDGTSSVIDHDTEENLYNENGIISTTSQLPLFQSNIQGNAALLTTRPRLQMNQNAVCFNQNYGQYSGLDQNLYVIYNTISTVASISFVLLTCVLFFAIGLAFLFILTGMAGDIPRALVKSWLPCTIGFILSAVLIGGIAVIIDNRDSIYDTAMTSKTIYHNNCFENPFINTAFLDLSQGLPDSLSVDIAIIQTMMWFTIVITLLLFSVWLSMRD